MRFAQKFAWGKYRNEKPGRHLDINNPQIVNLRGWIQQAIKDGRAHERLIANFDQVWTLTYEPLKKVAFKQVPYHGEKPLSQRLPQKADLMRALRNSVGLPPVMLGICLGVKGHAHIHMWDFVLYEQL